MSMLLQNKNAVIYGAGGSLGGAIARAFAKAGAKVFLSGHHIEPVESLAKELTNEGAEAEAAQIDAANHHEVNTHVEAIAARAGTVDICFNAIGWQDTQNIPLVDMSLEDFTRPVNIAMQTQFITSTAAGRKMKGQRSGVILSLTATPGGIGYPLVGGFGPACCAVEAFTKNLASELGRFGVRAVNIRSGGSPDSRVFKNAIEQGGDEIGEIMAQLKNDTMLKELPLMADIANTAVFLASDMAAKITGVTIDVTCGTTSALNYKMANMPFGA